jgi:mono/diheme cytochrome c family protein
MKAQRFMAVALAGVAVVAGIAGCGSDSKTSDASTPPAASTPAPAATTPAAPAAGGATAGKEIFASSGCGGCHSLKAAGASGAIGPNLDNLAPEVEQVVTQVTNGGGGMPAFGGKLSDKEIQDVAAYVADSTG